MARVTFPDRMKQGAQSFRRGLISLGKTSLLPKEEKKKFVDLAARRSWLLMLDWIHYWCRHKPPTSVPALGYSRITLTAPVTGRGLLAGSQCCCSSSRNFTPC